MLGPVGSAVTDGRYSATGGTILVLSTVVWTHGLIGLLDTLRPQAAAHPFAASLLLWIPGPLMPLSLFVLAFAAVAWRLRRRDV